MFETTKRLPPPPRRVRTLAAPLVATLLSGALGARHVAAQAAAAQAAAACTPDTSTTVKRLTVGMTAEREPDSTVRELSTGVAVQVATFFEPPSRLTIDKLRGPSEWKDATGSYKSEGLLSIGQLVVDLGDAGHARAALDPGTGSPEVDHALLAAAATVDSAGFFPHPDPGARASLRHVRLWVLTASTPPSTWAAPLFAVAGRVPAHATSAAVESEPAPSFPAALRERRVEGDVYLAFEVDAQGHVPETSLRVLSADDSAFIEPAKQSIRESRFVAATQGGCAVSSTMRQRMRFRLPEGGAAAAPASAAASPPAGGGASAGGSADEGRWLAANLPKLATGHVLVEVAARIGGTDVASGRTRVVHAKLEGCTLTLDRVIDIEGADADYAMTRVRQVIPLGHVDPRSVAVQQRPPAGPSGSSLKSQPWRVVLALRDGSIRTDVDAVGRRASSNETTLDLIVSDQGPGLEVAQHVQAAVQACQ
jgi:TonB family protein